MAFVRPLVVALAVTLAACATPASNPLDAPRTRAPSAVVGKTWEWRETVTPVEKIVSQDPTRYTVSLGADGRAAIRADCNRGTGAYEIAEGKLTFKPIALTRAMCPPGSQSDRFVRDLQRVSSFFLMNDSLFVEMPYDSGTLRFTQAK